MTSPFQRDVVFTDTETTGFSAEDHIWEFAAIRRTPTGVIVGEWHRFIQHDLTKAANLPKSFRADHDARYDPTVAISVRDFANLLVDVFGERPHVVGAVPNFDTERYARILAHYGAIPTWHHHLQDVKNLSVGYLLGRASLGDQDAVKALENRDDSDALSRACGVEPPTTKRHTAMGDALWAMALFDALHAPSR